MKTPNNRRQTPDRRNYAKRRRYADARSVHIELCQSVLRVVLVTQDEAGELPLLEAFSVRWRHDADNPTSEQGRTELAAALGTLVEDKRLAGCSVSLAINGTLCVNRAVSGAVAKVEQEIADLKERSQLYLALGPGPKTTAIGRRNVDARHEHALITVTNQRTLDVLIHAAELAGLVVNCVESALVALSRLHGALELDESEAAIVAQLDEECFEVGVCRDGQLLVEYRPSSETTVRSLGQVIDDHHERLERFCARQYGVGAMQLKQLWLAGEKDEVALTDSKTEVELVTSVLPTDQLESYWRLEQDTEVNAEMGAALGLALRDRLDDIGVCPNLMDEVLARAKQPIRPFLLKAAAPLAAALLLTATLWTYNVSKQYEIAALRTQVDQTRPAVLEGQRLAAVIRKQAVEAGQLAKLVERTPSGETGPLVGRLGQHMPEGVWLKSLRLNGREQFDLSGLSNSESGVYRFVQDLEGSPDFQEVALRGTGVAATPNGPATSFNIEIKLAPLASGGGKP